MRDLSLMDRFTMMRDWPALDEDNEYILEVDGRLSADASKYSKCISWLYLSEQMIKLGLLALAW